MLLDTRVIARQSAAAGAMEVLAQRHEVMWRDGTAVVLHPVQANGLPMLMLRAVATAGGALALVDLGKLVRRLDGELRACPARDVPGLVFYTLRQAYGSGPAFMADVTRKAAGHWQPVGTGWVWLAAPRAVDAETLATADLAALPQPTGPGALLHSAWGAPC